MACRDEYLRPLQERLTEVADSRELEATVRGTSVPRSVAETPALVAENVGCPEEPEGAVSADPAALAVMDEAEQRLSAARDAEFDRERAEHVVLSPALRLGECSLAELVGQDSGQGTLATNQDTGRKEKRVINGGCEEGWSVIWAALRAFVVSLLLGVAIGLAAVVAYWALDGLLASCTDHDRGLWEGSVLVVVIHAGYALVRRVLRRDEK